MADKPASGGGRRAAPGPRGGLGLLAAKAKKRWPRRLLIGVNVVVVALLALGASGYGYVHWRFGQVKRIDVSGLTGAGPGASPPLTIMVVGSDTRDLGKGGSSSFGNSEDVTGQRSDTIMLVRVVPATSSVALLSIPRDLLVQLPGQGTTRINAAFGGGANLLVQTVQQDLGVQVNHFAVVNFDTFTQISNSIGGVYQYFPAPARDLFSNLVVPQAGCVLLKGSQALAFVRSREYQYYLDGSWQYQLVPESDLARIQRQQDFIKLALKKAENVGPTNPVALNSVISGITSSLTVDSGFSSSLMINLALAMRHANVAGIPSWTYPTVNSTEVSGALDPVPSADQQVVSQFLNYGMPPQKTPPATAASAVAPSSITVSVLNGSGVADQAEAAADSLRKDGFIVSSTGDAANFNYSQSVVEYGSNGLAAAQALQAQVGGGATLQQVTTVTGDTLVLITGQGYAAANGHSSYTTTVALKTAGPAILDSSAILASVVTSAPSSSSSTSVPVEPDSSSYYHGQYIPPGLQPGQVPPTCPS